jgi:3-oxoadipate enol-lactonase
MLPSHSVHGADDAWPLVLIHGFPFSRAQWEPQIQPLARDYRVIAYDLRGHGTSPVGPGPLMIEFLVDDLIELLDHHHIPRATICGLSMGGYVALRAVDRHPDRVHGLILCDTRAGPDSSAGRLKRAEGIRAIRAHGMGAFADKMLPALFGTEVAAAGGPAVTHIREIMAKTDPDGACQALGAMAARLDLTDALPRIDTPTLVIVGEKDTLTPPTDARDMQAAIPGAALVELPGAGHVSNVERPEPFNDAVGSFLHTLRPNP